MNYDDITLVDGLDQRHVYEEFKKYCKIATEHISENGVKTLRVTNGNPHPYYVFNVEFIPKESPLSMIDRIFVPGFRQAGYTLETLLKLGKERLGEDAFNTREQVAALNQKIDIMNKINPSPRVR